MLVLFDETLGRVGIPHRQPTSVTRLWKTPATTVDLRLFCIPENGGVHVLSTVRVVSHADAIAIELTYDEDRFPEPVSPDLLAAACVAGIHKLWGGPGHFIRFAAHLLARTAGRLSLN